MASDARDILGDAAGAHIKSNHSERKSEKKSKRKKPDGMSNEVYGLLSSNSNDPHPLVPTFSANGGYKVGFIFRWLKINVIYVVFHISIPLFSPHLK